MSERDIFIATVQQATPEQRRAYLDEVCRGNEAVRRGVEALLEKQEQAGSFLQSQSKQTKNQGSGKTSNDRVTLVTTARLLFMTEEKQSGR
jgi:hypothetical protein